jgi:hypothetical protein
MTKLNRQNTNKFQNSILPYVWDVAQNTNLYAFENNGLNSMKQVGVTETCQMSGWFAVGDKVL